MEKDAPHYPFISNVDKQYAKLVLYCYEVATRQKQETINYMISLGRDDTRKITLKHLYTQSVEEELKWFLSGSTDIAKLRTSIWQKDVLKPDWAVHDKGTSAGRIYGAMWNDFNGENQIKNAIEALLNYYKGEKELRRRILVSAWDPRHMNSPKNGFACLPPCHFAFQLVPNDNNTIDMIVNMRSVDVVLGLPFNIYSYGQLQAFFAVVVGKEVGTLTFMLSNCHMYKEHTIIAEMSQWIVEIKNAVYNNQKPFCWGRKIHFPMITSR